ncbi:MAG: SUF system NifU family Fe-S cluster assembly protein [Proteobacteria bacterium]|nr:SUF system NifU family Fe-S cluster assembly protein [Pseudomonadota bacterium]
MSDLDKLYRAVILEHSKNPHNFAIPDSANYRADGHNPLCGDQVTLGLDIGPASHDDNGVEIIRAIGFRGVGCAISMAAASMMTEVVKGLTPSQAEILAGEFEALVKPLSASPEVADRASEHRAALETLAAFAGVAEHPMRIKCATLCWQTLRAALTTVSHS